ncbi:DUF1830 domain-containing protein [Merismopedia glauca]|uniref:DUF1830 domain-containing protein n=1 Tax=Merismopedia glauca CCAP 1448/3 TaxID=1296344 RepID=A0A2T1C4U2_9CYAN|nr:hypothetical protein C7B64_08980 [Merismopedia glauca CCAP 1448/3]
MSYLFSLVTTKFSPQESRQILCYYINNTSEIQITRAISGLRCDFERVVFSKERILFAALPESCLEVYSYSIAGIRLSQIDCQSLRINGKSDPSKNLA